MALTKDKSRLRIGEALAMGRCPVAANAVIKVGSIVMANAAGYAVQGAAATGQFVQGIATEARDATGLANGALTVPFEEGDFELESGTAGDALTLANRGDVVFIIDDDTAGATNGGATRSNAGTLVDISPNGKPVVRVKRA